VYLHGVGNRSPTRVGGGARLGLTPRVMAHTLVGAGGRLCEAETSRGRRRLVKRGGDFSCEAETCRGDPSCREPVGDATNWPETGRLASVGLDRGPQTSSS
jgi:hypothetical protein